MLRALIKERDPFLWPEKISTQNNWLIEKAILRPFLQKDRLEIELGGAPVHVRGDVDEVMFQAAFDALRPS